MECAHSVDLVFRDGALLICLDCGDILGSETLVDAIIAGETTAVDGSEIHALQWDRLHESYESWRHSARCTTCKTMLFHCQHDTHRPLGALEWRVIYERTKYRDADPSRPRSNRDIRRLLMQATGGQQVSSNF